MTGSFCPYLMLWSLLLCLIISTVSELQLIAATYIWEYINENLFSVLFAIINTQKNFNHVTLDVCKSIWSWKTLFCSIRESFCSANNKFCDFLNLWNFLFAKVTWRNVSTRVGLVLTRVGLVLTRADSCWLVLD